MRWLLVALSVFAGCQPARAAEQVEVVLTMPQTSLTNNLNRFCEKFRCEGTTEEERLQWALNRCVSLISGWNNQVLNSIDVTVELKRGESR